MNRSIATLCGAALALAACQEQAPTPDARGRQAQQAAAAANAITFTSNAEIDNIQRRLRLTSDPALLGFIVLFNDAGQPIRYDAVKGKVTSGSKRLTEPDRTYERSNGNAGTNIAIRQAPSDEGTWGSSSPYIYYWTQAGEYVQWSGHYLYSDKPIRLRVEPLVISVAEQTAR